MSSRFGAKAFVALAALAALGVGAVVVFHEREEASPNEGVSVDDASVDARATVAKPKSAKKKAARGGKTHVAGRGGGSGAAQGGGGHASANGPSEPSSDDGGEAATERRGHGGHAAPSGPSYESALDSNNDQLTIGAKTALDLSDAQLSAPMSDGTFISECGAPDTMGVTVKVAIKMGRAVGVSVSTSPFSADVAGCIDHHIRGLSWPASPKMDSLVTTY
ncbi:hypothetical protein [Labilithrix luteola]|uniref:hypothetical protein n=1 Tax=Labilithrix luteola TaxID=1391654 RepID=UPI0011BA9005|nr:hypothetical protein [Labilithrix luteola]